MVLFYSKNNFILAEIFVLRLFKTFEAIQNI